MKHGKRPSLNQKKFLHEKGLNCENWLISKDTPKEIIIVNKNSGNIKKIQKD